MKNPFKRNALEISVQQDRQYRACKEVQDIIDQRMKDCGYDPNDPNDTHDMAVVHYGFTAFIEFPRKAQEIYEKYGIATARAYIYDTLKEDGTAEWRIG